MPRRPATLAVPAAVLLLGCGGSDDKPVQLPDAPAETVYRGKTSQGMNMRIEAGGRAVASMRFDLRCKDGSQTEATVTTRPKSPTVESDGSFYYSETGEANFRGFGDGRYRTAVSGQLQGRSGAGTASFRISFQSTSCRGNARWQVNKA